MFRNWGFLMGELWVLLLLAALLGLFAGWLIWSRREVNVAGDTSAHDAQIAAMQAELASRDQELAQLRGNLDNCHIKVSGLETDLAACRAANASPVPTSVAAEPQDVVEVDAPLRLDGPRGGVADDLKRIKGIGPQMEKLCNSLGFYHFDQLASWTEEEVAWVDQNLEGFQGRVVRDQWVDQARALDAGEETEFSRRVDKGAVPSSKS